MRYLLVLALMTIGIQLHSAVSFDANSSSNEVVTELRKLNENILILISKFDSHNILDSENNKIIIERLNLIFQSLQPNAYDMNGNLITD